MYQHLYKRFLSARPDIQHFACHSHHYWPDVTREAMLEYWDDTAQMADDKWNYIFSKKMPQTQALVANALNIKSPERVVFAPNTHELLVRIHSSFAAHKKVKILTTDSEFYSFERQSQRWLQSDLVEIVRVPTAPFDTFEQRFAKAAHEQSFDWIFVSQVFFNSGFAIKNLKTFVDTLPTQPLITVDGYHGFFAIPTDLSELEHKVFYLSGSYKYAQGGEGACFAVVPDGNFEPIYTGWFAEFGDLHQRKEGHVGYAQNGQQFAGATMDMSPMYRLNASLQLFKDEGLSVEQIHEYVKQCQLMFLQKLQALNHPLLNLDNLMQHQFLPDKRSTKQFDKADGELDLNKVEVNELGLHGHFLTFKLEPKDVQSLAEFLSNQGIKTDYRGDRLRFGFAIYHNPLSYDLSCLE
ncbi:aminotransferase class V-fold PLP-dependent enzyme [Psychrosphaera aestuarii]|uniref:aminotransferase class V-fold PLP-dependent enzyme n=1 Tax=Psychrosphaera aestuarii TaxID=1266052 RepID=UPI001B31B8C2|nr:aminotransferase class V-fold PLP-dependent enzyme [Psychrosphaera aestuarii]